MTNEPGSGPEISDEALRELIDSHDPPTPPVADADDVLDQQRTEHEQRPTETPDIADDGIAPLINNVGDDGGAASG